VYPQLDPLRRADAVLILGGYEYERYPFGLRLAAEGWAPVVALSNPNGAKDAWLTSFCETPHREYVLHCFIPDPLTTRGEARALSRLAERYKWRTVIVVTARPQISRARFILAKCFDGSLVMVASPTKISIARWAYEYAYQSAGFVRATFEHEC